MKGFFMKSNFFSLNTKDFIRGAVVAIGTAAGTGLINIMNTGALPTLDQLHTIGISAACAGIAYLLKNLFTNSKDQLAKPEVVVLPGKDVTPDDPASSPK
jgi:hypothetical protein